MTTAIICSDYVQDVDWMIGYDVEGKVLCVLMVLVVVVLGWVGLVGWLEE
jgi:hypothetical protein